MYEKKLRGWVGKIIELSRKLGGGNLEKDTHIPSESYIVLQSVLTDSTA